MSQWGKDHAHKPKDIWITAGAGANTANVYASKQGWVFRRPWGDEVIVAIGNLLAIAGSASKSPSASASPSKSPSASFSPSASKSPSASISPSA